MQRGCGDGERGRSERLELFVERWRRARGGCLRCCSGDGCATVTQPERRCLLDGLQRCNQRARRRRRLDDRRRGRRGRLHGLAEPIDEIEQLSTRQRRIRRRRDDQGCCSRRGWRDLSHDCSTFDAEHVADLGTRRLRGRRFGIGRQQRPAPVSDGLRPFGHFEPQRLVDGREEAGTVAADRRLARWDIFVAHHARRRVWRTLAGDGLIERGAERVDVGPRTLLPRIGSVLFVGAIAGLHERADGPRLGGDLAPRGAEVDQDRRLVAAYDNVVGRDVAMQEVALMDHFQRVEQRAHERVKLGLAWRAAKTSQPRLEAAALFELQHHVAGVVGPEIAIDANDIRVIEAGECLGFIDEAVEAPFIILGTFARAREGGEIAFAGGVVGRKIFLDGDLAAERQFIGKISDPEAACPQHLFDAEVAGQFGAVWKCDQIAHGNPPPLVSLVAPPRPRRDRHVLPWSLIRRMGCNNKAERRD